MNWWLFYTLLLAPLVLAKSAADYYVQSLPGQPEGPPLKMHAGHIEINPDAHANMFFWHFDNKHIADKQRTVIWLNGGPGCSSMDGALMEVGPYRLTPNGTLYYNEGSWNEYANLLFLDQPVGTGFSYADTDKYMHELDETADQMVVFLTKFFELFPHYEPDDLYIAGESYAGQYIPYLAKAILDRNKEAEKKWNLKGLLIGNGWVSPEEQYESYTKFVYKKGIVEPGTEIAARLEAARARCQDRLRSSEGRTQVSVPSCENILHDIMFLTKQGDRCINIYDVRVQDEYPACGMNWPQDLSYIYSYLRQPEVLQALHLNKDKNTGWVECSGPVNNMFTAKNSLPSVQLLPGLLESGLRILFYNGAEDLICNHIGTEDLLANLHWGDGTGFELSPGIHAPRVDWILDGERAGFYQSARNLTYVNVFNASHMIPFENPRRSLDILNRAMGVHTTGLPPQPANLTTPTDIQASGQTEGSQAPPSTETDAMATKHARKVKLVKTAAALAFLTAAVVALLLWMHRRRRVQVGHAAAGKDVDSPAPTRRMRGAVYHGVEDNDDNNEGVELEEGEMNDGSVPLISRDTERETDLEAGKTTRNGAE